HLRPRLPGLTVRTEVEPFAVVAGQTYVPCRTAAGSRCRPFVVERVRGDDVYVWDPFGGIKGLGGHRWVKRSSLHPTGRTDRGAERRTGYRLKSGPPAPGQELCGTCMTYVGPDDLAVSAWGSGHSTCKPCMADIERQYGQR
ncbi:hypothetical protein KDL01_41805, partial [Actinospica durhamensis]